MKRTYHSRRGRGVENDTYHRHHVSKTNGVGARQRNTNTTSTTAKLTTMVPAESLEGWILFVTNLHEETSEDDIKEAFGEYGRVNNIGLNLDRRTGFVKGYALVEYASREEAASARECLNQSELLGVTLKVDWCFTRPIQSTPTAMAIDDDHGPIM